MQITDVTHLDVIIIDDEIDACNNLQNILNEEINAGINIIGIAHNTIEANKLIIANKPDAVFIDIEMPSENAFQFLDRISPFQFDVVFVTAYDEFAIRAFKLNAVDYILKPININEVRNAVDKLIERKRVQYVIRENYDFQALHTDANSRQPSKIVLKENNDVEVVDFKQVLFVEANGSYSKFFFVKDDMIRTLTMSNNIAEYESLFPVNLFYRVHKSYLVNCSCIKKIIKEDNIHIVINEDHSLPVSRRRYVDMMAFLKANNFYSS